MCVRVERFVVGYRSVGCTKASRRGKARTPGCTGTQHNAATAFGFVFGFGFGLAVLSFFCPFVGLQSSVLQNEKWNVHRLFARKHIDKRVPFMRDTVAALFPQAAKRAQLEQRQRQRREEIEAQKNEAREKMMAEQLAKVLF